MPEHHPHADADLAEGSRAALSHPRAFFFDVADALRVTSFNAVTGAVVTLEGRFLTRAGEITPFRFDHTPNTDRTSASTTFPMGSGWLLDVQARASSGSPRRGQTFLVVEVVRGLTGSQVPLSTLLQGYVTDTSRRSWPGSRVDDMAGGPGVLRSITGTDPAAGAEISETVPTNARWRPLAIQFDLVTGATGTTQEVALVLDDGTTVFARVPIGTTQGSSVTRTYCFAHHLPRNTLSQDTTFNAPFPRVDLQGGYRIRTITANLGGDDNYGAPQLLVEEWIED